MINIKTQEYFDSKSRTIIKKTKVYFLGIPIGSHTTIANDITRISKTDSALQEWKKTEDNQQLSRKWIEDATDQYNGCKTDLDKKHFKVEFDLIMEWITKASPFIMVAGAESHIERVVMGNEIDDRYYANREEYEAKVKELAEKATG